MKIWVDGSGWNGKESKYAVAFEDGQSIIKKLAEEKTNNEMEYTALICALEKASDNDEIFTDSKLLVGQLCEGWKVKKQHLFPLFIKARNLLIEKKVKLQWIPRKENCAGWLLEK